jgi:hypothetical protein
MNLNLKVGDKVRARVAIQKGAKFLYKDIVTSITALHSSPDRWIEVCLKDHPELNEKRRWVHVNTNIANKNMSVYGKILGRAK